MVLTPPNALVISSLVANGITSPQVQSAMRTYIEDLFVSSRRSVM